MLEFKIISLLSSIKNYNCDKNKLCLKSVDMAYFIKKYKKYKKVLKKC